MAAGFLLFLYLCFFFINIFFPRRVARGEGGDTCGARRGSRFLVVAITFCFCFV